MQQSFVFFVALQGIKASDDLSDKPRQYDGQQHSGGQCERQDVDCRQYGLFGSVYVAFPGRSRLLVSIADGVQGLGVVGRFEQVMADALQLQIGLAQSPLQQRLDIRLLRRCHVAHHIGSPNRP